MTGSGSIQVFGIGRWTARGEEGDLIELGPAHRETLACLVASGPRGGHRDQLAEALYPAGDPQQWAAKFRVRVSRLRAVMPEGAIPPGSPDGIYRIALEPDQVDLWSLEAMAAASQSSVAESDLYWALAGDPYPDVSLPHQVAQAASSAKRAQRTLVERFCAQAPSNVSYQLGGRLAWVVRNEAFDEDLAIKVANCLADAGHYQDAARVLGDLVDRFQTELGDKPVRASAALDRLRWGGSERSTLGDGPDSDQSNSAASSFPAQLARFQGRLSVGRDTELSSLLSGSTSLVTGARGGGKSQLLADLAATELERGNEVTYLVAQEDFDVELSPFLAALPELAPLMAGDSTWADPASGETEQTLLSKIWTTTMAALEPANERARRHLLIDDAQWLDRRSAALVQLLANATTSRPLAVTIAGRGDDQEPGWVRLQQGLGQLGFERIELGGLDLRALETLIAVTHPHVTAQARRALALEVLAKSAGLPLAARAVIDAIDPETLTVPDRVESGPDLGWVIADLEEQTKTVGLVAAVLGHTFSAEAVVALCGLEGTDVIGVLSTSQVEQSLDRLIESGHIFALEEGHGAESPLSFDHVLTQEAFLALAPPFLSRKLHLAAAERTSDVHAEARYLVRAGKPHQAAGEALRRSAEEHFLAGQWWASARQLRQCERLQPDQLTIDDRIRFAASLDLSGQDGTALRRVAFSGAVDAQEWDKALSAATAALPSAERPDGDEERLTLLRSIPPESLSPGRRFAHAQHLARQLSLNGDASEAQAWADRALDLAVGPRQTAAAHISCWTARHHFSAEPYRFPEEVVSEASGLAMLRMKQMQSISSMEMLELEESIKLHRVFRSEARAKDDPLRIWQAMAYDSLLAFEQGRWRTSEQLSERAHQYGLLHGHQEATSVRAGQLFHLRLAAGEHGSLLPFFELIPANVGRSSMAQAAFILCQAAGGDRSKSVRLAVDLVSDVLQRRRSASVVVAALLSSLLVESGNEGLVSDARKFLLPFADRSIVVGFGVANMGPMWRYLASLADDDIEQESWLEAAVEASERLGSPSWLVLNMLSLADFTGSESLRQEAILNGRGTDIFQVPS